MGTVDMFGCHLFLDQATSHILGYYIMNGEYATRYFSSGVLEPKVGVATSENPISRHPSCTEAGIFLS